METIKKKFITDQSAPLPIGEGLIFRIFAKAGSFLSYLPIYIRSGEIVTVNWGEGTIRNYSSGVISKEINMSIDTYLDVTISTNKEDICVTRQSSNRSYISEVVSWGDKQLINSTNFVNCIFNNESYLTNIAEDTNNVFSTFTDVREIFKDCHELVSVPKLDTSNCMYMADMFKNNHKLEAVYGLDLSSVQDLSSFKRIFGNPVTFNLLKKLYISNIGKSSAEYFDFSNCIVWDKESMLWTAEQSVALTTGTKYIYLYTTVGYDEPVAVWKSKGYTVNGIMN